MSDRICYILRSVPSGGKSTLAKKLKQEAESKGLCVVMASADDYFLVKENGELIYRYEPEQIRDAHRMCQLRAEDAMKRRVDIVIVDNTNTTAKETYPYVKISDIYGYEVKFLEPTSPWWLAVKPLLKGNKKESLLKPYAKVFAEKNTHGVPEYTILRMLMRWEDFAIKE